MVKRNSILIMLILLLSFMPLASHAYTFTGYKIFNQIRYVASYSFGSASMSAMNEAIYKWNSNAGWDIMSRDPRNRHYENNINTYDGKNYIYKEFGGDYLAANYTRAPNGILIESDINFNSLYNWANSAQPGAYDVESVFLHETGHSAGLGHSTLSSAVMYRSISANTTKRQLTQDDVNGIKALY